MLNNIRFDLSDYLIHFFRDVDLSGPEHIFFPEHARFNNIAHSGKLDSLFLMRCALRHHKLFATWSYRGGRPTIYGTSPAICFTDMPLAAFIQTSNERLARGENIGRYAFMIPKAAMFAEGARPVIYGLSGEVREQSANGGDFRILDQQLMPLREQYRYVAYTIGDARHIDWTHEREWRWPYRGHDMHWSDDGDMVQTLAEMPGLDLSRTSIEGMGVIVKDSMDVKKIIYDILTLVDSQIIHKSMIRFVIPLCDIERFGDITNPARVSHIINQNSIDLSPFFSITPQRAKEICTIVDNIIKDNVDKRLHSDKHCDESYGKSWVWIADNQSELVRALIAKRRLIVSTEGRYLLDISDFTDFYIMHEEFYCKKIALALAREFYVNASYFTVRGATDCDHIPSYTGLTERDHPFFNSTIAMD
ncbi:hypothetical protein FHW75_003959 [Pseudomonas sp. OG7]|uniref:DUF4427 domain-containing protein n=1 Tax=Pseudomonas sp. OG7 TaxID=2587037 RepID=UPI0016121139|nr:DUF4427 domain-containing protein [Pseudomonas sp. OG7]MBB3272763.1 hypothetical protein [Pseudomonas sp. OG7]